MTKDNQPGKNRTVMYVDENQLMTLITEIVQTIAENPI